VLFLMPSMTAYRRIVILTGAGLSAESGLGTFRDRDGIWSRYDLEEVATPQGFARDPALVQDFYNARRAQAAAAKPNAAHEALARLEAEHGESVLTVTQNIDPLHEAAGSANLIHMHGELFRAWCRTCDARLPWEGDIACETPCPACAHPGGLRPDVVWFGEMPFEMQRIYETLAYCDLFVAIGTSGVVYPAADFVRQARLAIEELPDLLERDHGDSISAR